MFILVGHFGHIASLFASEHLQAYFDDALMNLRDKCIPSSSNPARGKIRINPSLMLNKSTSELWRALYLLQDEKDIIIPADAVNLDLSEVDKYSDCDDINPSRKPAITAADTVIAIEQAFKNLHSNFLEYASNIGDFSGTTATVALLFDDHVLISHVGDSRAVLCCSEGGSAIPLTVDHNPDVLEERLRVESAGGFVEKSGQGHINRVNGKLAVTRSIGDRKFDKEVLSHIPDVLLLRRPRRNSTPSDVGNASMTEYHIFSSCMTESELSGKSGYDFLILASDGLWEVVSDSEAVNFVCDYLISQMKWNLEHSILRSEDISKMDWIPQLPPLSSQYLPPDAMHNAARALALEAYVRGSSDNIGVCIVEID